MQARWTRPLWLLSALVAAVGCHHSTAPAPATLLHCPSTQAESTTTVLSATGGIVSVAGTSVSIPAGALASATAITLRVPASQYMEIEVRANDLASFVFQQAVSITIDYSRCSPSEANRSPLSVWRIDTQTKALLQNMGGTDDKTSHTITFSTGHLSGYAVAF